MYQYEEVLYKIEHARRFESLPGVEVSGKMLKKLGFPQKGLPFIHVAGTNGKGSVCAFLNRIFMEAGLKTGCFTSPHLIDFRERITVNNAMISREDVTRLGNSLLKENFGVVPTMFDSCLMMAVLYFKEQNCDVAVVETGLGGRLDSTNALGNPDAAVITRIGYDHMSILGNTLPEIAAEKAGILKPGVPAVIAPQEPEVLEVLLSTGTGDKERYIVGEKDMERARNMQPGLKGDFQIENAATALLAAELFLKKRKMQAEPAIRNGIHNAVWPGRMELLSEDPFFMVDGAHNSNGIHALKVSLEKMYPGESFHFVMGVLADKDYEKMVEELLPVAIDFVTVTPESSRALQGEKLAESIRQRGIHARSIRSVQEVKELPVAGEKTVALGSLYFIGDVRALYQKEL